MMNILDLLFPLVLSFRLPSLLPRVQVANMRTVPAYAQIIDLTVSKRHPNSVASTKSLTHFLINPKDSFMLGTYGRYNCIASALCSY